jgi:hypothetical protein
LQEGRKQGESKILRRQLQRRFGSLPTWVAEKMECATTDQLESWADALLDAPTLGAVFGDDADSRQ